MAINPELEQQVQEAGNFGIPLHSRAATLKALGNFDLAQTSLGGTRHHHVRMGQSQAAASAQML